MAAFTLTVRGMTFRGTEEGPSDGPLALLLHGFPDSHQTWRHLSGPLAALGYHVVAPALRGYAPSDLASDGNYQMASLVLDVVAIEEALRAEEKSVLIGHDWGAIIAYGAAALVPDVWSKMVTMAVPPPDSIANSFMTYDQLQRSWYMFFFQNALADFVVPMDDLAFLDGLWADWSPGYNATDDLEFTKQALREPDRISAALGYYRSMFQADLLDPALQEVQDALNQPTTIPTFYLHGEDDGCFGIGNIGDPLASLPEGSQFETVADAGHFLHLEQPNHVEQSITAFLQR